MGPFHGFEWDEAASPPWWAAAGLPAQPVLAVDFAAGTARRNGLIREIGQVLGFARATTATYVDADGTIKTAAPDAPRFDWSTGQRALLLETAATNLLVYSDQVNLWGADGLTIQPNATAAPDGTVTADQIIEDASTGHHRVKRAAIAISPQIYTASIYAKSPDRALQLTMFDGSGGWQATAVFDLQLGTLRSLSGATAVSAQITAVGGGWYRCVMVGACTAASGNAQILINLASSIGNGVLYAGNAQSGAVLWGAQLEAGAAPTSYIPTAGSAVTRAADIASPIDLSGFDLSGGYTAVVKGRLDGVAGAWDRLIQLDAGTNANRQSVVYNRAQSRLRAEVWSGNAASSMTEASAPLPFEARCAFAIAPDSFDYAQNGAASPHDDTVSYAQPEWMRIGSDAGGSQSPSRHHVSSVMLYPTVMTAAQLEEITA